MNNVWERNFIATVIRTIQGNGHTKLSQTHGAREYLGNGEFSITSNHAKRSTNFDSLALCLIQHSEKCYGTTHLKEALSACDFIARTDKNTKTSFDEMIQLLNVMFNEDDRIDAIASLIKYLCRNLNLFKSGYRLPTIVVIKCYGLLAQPTNYLYNLAENRCEQLYDEEPEETSAEWYYIWYDSARQVFESIYPKKYDDNNEATLKSKRRESGDTAPMKITLRSQRIDIANKTIHDRSELAEHLDNHCTILTKNNEQSLTLVESLVLCLIQHSSGNYFLTSLDYGYETARSLKHFSESGWNAFRGEIERKSFGLIPSETLKKNIKWLIQQLWKRFECFNVSISNGESNSARNFAVVVFGFSHSACYVVYEDNEFKIVNALNEGSSPFYVWYDKSQEVFEALAPLLFMYQNEKARASPYWDDLLCRFGRSLDQFLKRRFHSCSSSSEVEQSFDDLNKYLKDTQDLSFFSIQLVFVRWSSNEESPCADGIRIKCMEVFWEKYPELRSVSVCMEECLMTLDDNSHDIAAGWCKQLWEVILDAIAGQVDLEFARRRREIETGCRRERCKMDRAKEKVKQLKNEIESIEKRMAQKQAENKMLQEKLEVLAWNQLIIDIGSVDYVPDYLLVLKGSSHEYFQLKNGLELAETLSKVVQRSRISLQFAQQLKNYVKKKGVDEILEQLRSALNKVVGKKPSDHWVNDHEWRVEGPALVLSKVLSLLEQKGVISGGACQQVTIEAERVLYIDSNWVTPGVSLTILAPLVNIVSVGRGIRVIETSGKDGKPHELENANDGNGNGLDGSDGLDGENGQNAGNITIDCLSIENPHLLKLVARGGNGSNGQDGGDGASGKNGEDGENGSFGSDEKEESNWYIFKDLHKLITTHWGGTGSNGQAGGSGGKAGCRGIGGHEGEIRITFKTNERSGIEKDYSNGATGKQGTPGKGGISGRGGQHGQDAVYYFEGKDSTFRVCTGDWKKHLGSRNDVKKKWLEGWFGDRHFGYHRTENSNPKWASAGKRGREGERANQRQNQNSRTRNSGSLQQRDRSTNNQSQLTEMEQAIAAQRVSQEEIKRESQTLSRCTAALDSQRNRISNVQQEIELAHQEITVNETTRQRVKVKIHEMLQQHIVHQVVVRQNVTRQINLQFENDNQLGLQQKETLINLNPLTLHAGSRSGSNTAESTQILDNLLFSDGSAFSIEDRLKLMNATQMLHLKLGTNRQDYNRQWLFVGKLIEKYSNSTQRLIAGLEFLEINQGLMMKLLDRKTNRDLIEVLRTFLASIETYEGDAIGTLFEFGVHDLPYQTSKVLLGGLELKISSNDAQLLLALAINNRMLGQVTKEITDLLGDDRKTARRCAELLWQVYDLHSLPHKMKETAQTSDADLTDFYSSFFDELYEELFKIQESTAARSKTVYQIVKRFVRIKLGYHTDNLKVEDLSHIQVTDVWKIIFLVNESLLEATEMDAIKEWTRKSNIKNKNVILSYLEQSFYQNFLDPSWTEVRRLLTEKENLKTERLMRKLEDIENATRVALSKTSFQEKSCILEQLKDALRNVQEKEESVFEMISHKAIITVEPFDGFFAGPSGNSEEAIVLNIVEKLDTATLKNLVELNWRISTRRISFDDKQIAKFCCAIEKPVRKISQDSSYDLQYAQSTFRSNWNQYLLNKVADERAQVDRLSANVLKKFKKDPSKEIGILALILRKFELYTSTLEPTEAGKLWKQLDKISVLKDVVSEIRSKLNVAVNKLLDEVKQTITKLESTYRKMETAPSHVPGNDIVLLVARVQHLVTGCTEVKSNSSLFQNGNSMGELFNIMDAVRLLVNIMDIEDPKKKKESKTYDTICGLKKAFSSWRTVPQYGGTQEAVKTHKHLLNSLAGAFSIDREDFEDEDPRRAVYDTILNHIGEIRTSHDGDLKLIGELSSIFSDPRSGIDFCQLVERTSLVYFSLRPSGLSNERKSHLFDAIIRVADIKQQDLVEKNLTCLFGLALKRASEQNGWLYTSIAILIGNLLKSEWHLATWKKAELWSNHLELIEKRKKENFEDACEMLLSLQQHLLDYCRACYVENLLKTTSKSSDTVDLNMANLTFNNAVSLTTDVMRFANATYFSKPHGLAISQVSARQEVLKTIIRLGLSQVTSWPDNTIICHLLRQDDFWNKDNKEFKRIISKAFDGGTNSETRRRGTFVKRLISLRHVEWTDWRLDELDSRLNKSYQDLSVVVGYDIFTEEERSFVNLIDNDVGVRYILTSEYPSCYLNSLQNLAIKRALESFVRCFLPNFAGISLNQEADFKKEKTNTDEAHLLWIAKKFLTKKKAEGSLRDWIVWFNDVFITSLNSYSSDSGLTVNQVSTFLDDAANSNLELCRLITTTTRPHYWTRFLAVNIIKNSINRLGLSEAGDADAIVSSLVALSMRMTSETGNSLIRCLRDKVLAESKTAGIADLVCLIQNVASGLNEISELNSNIFENKQLVARFLSAGLIEWPKICRFARFASKWTYSLAQKVTSVFDNELGPKRADRLLDHAECRYYDNSFCSSRLEKIADNLIRFPWIREQCIKLAECSDVGIEQDELWASVSDVEIGSELAQKKEMTINDILTILSNDTESSLMMDDAAKRTEIQDFVERANHSYKSKCRTWNVKEIEKWTAQVKSPNSKSLQVHEFLAVASRAVELAKGYKPRDVQMLAVVLFVTGEDRGGKKIKRMAQISTGEGKTLITALLAIYHSLRHWNSDRHVNVITSSSVLAEASVSEIRYLYDRFGVSLSNNCDFVCSKDDRLRKERYNSDVIYGDLPSFMRDILLTRFFNKKITRGREPGAIIVDEVDSMLLDKGESVLYLSHNIPEMYHLRQLFVEIAGTVNAPDVQRLAESKDIVAEIRRFIEPRIDDPDIAVPNCLKGYVKLHLSTWIRSTLRAAYLLNAKDSYKIGDVNDGKGRQVIIMDKETGVEQIQTEWSDGLHPALQLKHGLKWTPTALKAVFMSNIGYFTEFNGRFYGVTGTLGSAAECDLLRNVFGVDFFRMPRFTQRFCIQHEPLFGSNEDEWLQNMEKAVEKVTKTPKPRAALIICENIFSAERICDKLSKTSQSKGYKVAMYISSFDTDFLKMQHEDEVGPGQVIVATNLAGRGTDFKLSKQLEQNGGLHVIISYVPPNARVEAQAEGRTARSGQPGSYQFVFQEGFAQVLAAQVSTDPYGKLCAFKIIRDDEERSRLEHLRLKAIPKIKLEEALFGRFFRKCIKPLRERRASDETVETIQDEEIDIKIHCLNNRWAIWLDDNAKLIECAHSDQVLSENLNEAFESFISSAGNARWSSPEKLAQTPSELMCVARFYENHLKGSSTNLESAIHCFKQIVAKEPLFCENALLEHVRLILLDKATYGKKREAKKLLVKAKKLINSRIEMLTGLNQVVSTLWQRTKSGPDPVEHFRFGEQTSNLIRLLQVHLSSINSLLGVPFIDSLSRQFHSEEKKDEQLNKVIDLAGSSNYYKLLRYSRKFKVINETKTEELYVDGSIVSWPSFLSHCQTELVAWCATGVRNQRRFNVSSLESKIAECEIHLWNQLIENGYMDKGRPASSYTIKAVNLLEPKQLEHFAEYKRILPGWLEFHEEEDFDVVSSTLGITNEDTIGRYKQRLIDYKLIVKSDRPIHKILKNIPSVQESVEADLVPGVPLVSCADVLAAWFPSQTNQKGQRVEQPDFDSRKAKLADPFKNYLIDVGILKQPAIKFSMPSSNCSKESIDSDLETMKNHFRFREDFNALARTLYEKEEKDSIKRRDLLAERLMMAIREHLGQLKTFAQMKSSFVYLYEDLPPGSVNPADELQQFDAQYFDRVGRFEEQIPYNWKTLWVAVLGVAQLAGAIAFPFFGAGLAAEGINDLIFAFQSFKSPGSFSWSTYAKGKLKGLAMMALTAGIGAAALIAKGGQSLMGAVKLLGRFNGTLKGWWQMGKQVLAKCADALLSSVVGQVMQKFFNWLKEFILTQVLSRVRSILFENPVCRSAFDGLRVLMDDVLKQARRCGRSLGEVRKLIKDAIDRASNPSAPSAIDMISRIKETAYGIRGDMLGAFGNAMGGLVNCQQNHLNMYQASSTVDGITESVNTGTFGKVIKKSVKIAERVKNVTKESQKIIKSVNNMNSILKLAAEPVHLVKDVNEQLRQELRRLESKQNTDQHEQSMVDLTKAQERQFDDLKTEMSKEIQDIIMKRSLDEIQSAWVQPALQAKLEKIIPEKLHDMGLIKLPPGADNMTDDASQLENEEQTDPAYEEKIEKIGEEMVGPVEKQLFADRFGKSIELVDETGDYSDGSGTFSYHPNGDPAKEKIRMKVTKNEDGRKHVELIMPNGTTYKHVPGPGESLDGCFYHAAAKALNKSSTEVISEMKDEAKSNERVRIMYNIGVSKKYSRLHTGAYGKCSELDVVRDELDRKTSVNAVITPANVATVLGSDNKVKEIVRIGKDGENVSHLVPRCLGGIYEEENLVSLPGRMTNQVYQRRHEKEVEKFCQDHMNEKNPPLIEYQTKIHYKYSVQDLQNMVKSKINVQDITAIELNFHLKNDPSNFYKSGHIPCQSNKSGNVIVGGDIFKPYFLQRESRHLEYQDPSTVSMKYTERFEENRKIFKAESADLFRHEPHNRKN